MVEFILVKNQKALLTGQRVKREKDDYFVNIRPEIVLVVPVTGDNQLVFVRQYRHELRKFYWNFLPEQ